MKYDFYCRKLADYQSPSVRRAWVEISVCYGDDTETYTSPSVRRAWVEIFSSLGWSGCTMVALRKEGVG